MKSRAITFFIIVVFGIFLGCNNDDDTIQNETINGKWNLKNRIGGLTPNPTTYDFGNVIWKFNTTTKILTIENTMTTNYIEDGYVGLSLLNSGTYTYEIQEIDNSQFLYINNSKRGALLIENNSLKINEGLANDGSLYTFER